MAKTTKNTSMLLEYIAETDRGTPASSGSLQRPSDAVTNVNLTGTNNGEVIYTIGDYDGQDTVYGLKEYTLSFEYDIQRTENSGTPFVNTLAKSIQYYALTRSSGLLTPLTFYVHTNSTTTYECRGCVIDSWSMNVTPGGRLHCTVNVSVASVACRTGQYTSLDSSTAWGNTFETFQGASITRTGGFDEGVGGFTVTINNNPSGAPNIGKQVYVNYYEGLQNLSGTVDVLLNSGGKTDWEEMTGSAGSGAPTEQSIVFNSGTSTTAGDKSMKWTFANAAYTNMPINFSAEDGYVVSGVTWTAESVTLEEYS